MQNTYRRITSKGIGGGNGGRLLYGLLVSLGILLAAVSVITLLVSNRKITMERCGPAVAVCYGVSVFVGCRVSLFGAKGNKLLRTAITAASTLALVLGCVYAMPGTHADAIGKLFGITVAAWVCSGLLNLRKKKKRYGL